MANHGVLPVPHNSVRMPEVNVKPSESAAVPCTGAQVLWDALVREGVTVVFGYPGGAIMPAYDVLMEYPIHHVLVRHEQGAAHMAEGYARASGSVGVVVATSGPGATNLTTGIADAMLDSTPIVCITAQVPGSLLGSDAFQEVDITGVTLPITKHNFLVTRADDIAPSIKTAFYVARSGRPGPVVVDITKDALQGACHVNWDDAPVRAPGCRPLHRSFPDELKRALEMIAEAQRPLILSGQGVIKANASAQLLEFVSRTNIPVASTLLGLGAFPASHPRSLGMMGMHGQAWVNDAVQEADLLIALGMRFDDRVTGNVKTYAPRAKKIHVELDPAEINKNVAVDLALVGDVREILELLLPRLRSRTCDAWCHRIDELRRTSSDHDPDELERTSDETLRAPYVMKELWRLTEGRAVVVTDVGQHQMWEAQYYKHDYPRKLITSGGLGTMGFGLPAAIGARFACPDDEIWVVCGDGGFQMTACELATIVQEQLKINIAVINNGYLGMVRQWQQFFYGGRYVATPITGPDLVKLADAHGVDGLRVCRRSEVQAAIQAAQSSRSTTLIDFQVEREDSVYPMFPAGGDLDKMIRGPAHQTPARRGGGHSNGNSSPFGEQS